MTTSQNGLSALLPTSRLLRTWQLPGSTTRLRLRQGSVGFLLTHLAGRFDRRVENLDGPVLDDWAYAYRPVRGYSVLSNHASGSAIDLNATQHPLGVGGTFTPSEVGAINALLRRYDGTIRWGGHYSGRLDAMHFEIDRPLADCERVARKLMVNDYGMRVLSANAGQRAVILS